MDGSVRNERGSGEAVLATYREIAERFGLHSGPDAGRMKAKRSGWPPEPQNHPLDPVRVRVPREAWDAADTSRSGRNAGTDSRERSWGNNPERQRDRELAELREALAQEKAVAEGLRTLVATLEAAQAGRAAEAAEARQEARDAREAADRRLAELAEARERIGRAEGERDRADQRVREMVEERDQAAHQVEAVRAELATWREGGPIARALRAFLYRRLV